MIIFPKSILSHQDDKRLKVLEKFLRVLGNFENTKPIEITSYRFDDANDDDTIYDGTIYMIQDLDNTIFEFYDYYSCITLIENYRKAFQLTLQRENSNFIYKYDFYRSFYKSYSSTDKLNMIEISCILPKNRIIRLKSPLSTSPTIIVEEKDKNYLFSYHGCENMDNIDSFNKAVERIKTLENFNLENLLPLLGHNHQGTSIYISSGTNTLAYIYLDKGIITEYAINEPNKKITVEFKNDITRSIERTLDDRKIEHTETIGTENLELLKSDYKTLFKQL